ncbi:LacI family DNA-binding transcriptional regulator [Paenibacillus whitsoniae]|uniref:LacI family transcriptional regulator n=1 Tax=Paenibacillus whitsoniae TaxID=2496558 RepID=A0A3S0A305_9BACL|nr:LacI family DNA-binding transcriptional regulator [Paenibacillus whitsoniae]RTE08352.1 LacI family transcriptional regulator [Paenibacillus whitsoniae]
MVSRKEVADRAGVSSAVVSYVLNDRKIVKEETRRKVLQAIEELGYQPNLLARSLKTKKTKQIAVLVNYLGNPFEAGILLHLEHELREHGYFVFFHTYRKEEEDQLKSVFMGRVDGILLLGQSLQASTVADFESREVPVVSVMQPGQAGSRIAYRDLDWEAELLKLIRHLQEQGHTRIGFMSGEIASASHYEVRFEGFLRALAAAGLTWHPEDQLDGGGRFEDAERALGVRLAAGKAPFTALVGANDLMAAGCLSACRGAGVRVPEELAVAGCENILMSAQTDPPLTTLHYPRQPMATEAVGLLLAMIDGVQADMKALDGELIVRGSTVRIHG